MKKKTRKQERLELHGNRKKEERAEALQRKGERKAATKTRNGASSAQQKRKFLADQAGQGRIPPYLSIYLSLSLYLPRCAICCGHFLTPRRGSSSRGALRGERLVFREKPPRLPYAENPRGLPGALWCLHRIDVDRCLDISRYEREASRNTGREGGRPRLG